MITKAQPHVSLITLAGEYALQIKVKTLINEVARRILCLRQNQESNVQSIKNSPRKEKLHFQADSRFFGAADLAAEYQRLCVTARADMIKTVLKGEVPHEAVFGGVFPLSSC